MAPVEVINASLGRTGTSSFCEAMNILGYNCHHMKRLLADTTFKTTKKFYDAAMDLDEADMDVVYEGYDATADWTGAFFYKKLFASYPNAKVVLTERPFEDWFESMKNTIYRSVREGPILDQDHPRYYFRQLCRKIILDGYIEDDDKYLDEEFLRKYYDDHIKEVKELVPADQLYCIKLGEGWEGICAFLGKDIPETPYPNVNSTASFNERLEKRKAAAAAAAAAGQTEAIPVNDLIIGEVEK